MAKKVEPFELVDIKAATGNSYKTEVTYRASTPNEGTAHGNWKREDDVPAHEDLYAALRAFKPYVLKIMRFEDMAKGKEAAQVFNEIVEGLKVNGIALKGADEKSRNLIIKAQVKGLGGQTFTVNPKIRLAANTFGFEDDLPELIEEVSNEAKAFVFQNKRAQLSIED